MAKVGWIEIRDKVLPRLYNSVVCVCTSVSVRCICACVCVGGGV